MVDLHFQVDEELAELLGPPETRARSFRELVVLHAYGRHELSGGRAARLLEMPLEAFMALASERGIPVISMTPESWEAELALLDRLWPARP